MSIYERYTYKVINYNIGNRPKIEVFVKNIFEHNHAIQLIYLFNAF